MSVLHCRFCEAELSLTFADLGETPLANSYLTSEDLGRTESLYPLHARVCTECFLVQLPEVATPEEIFGDYAYYSSYSTSWLEHSRRFAAATADRFGLGPDSLVIEVASNDGYLLQYFQKVGIPVLGIEPARNIAKDAIEAGIPTEARFFGAACAEDLIQRGYRPNLLIGNNVLAHVPDINDFVGGLAALLDSEGVLVVEFPHLLNLMAYSQFDTIYHEHFSYLSLLAVEAVFAAHGLTVFDVEHLQTHGGSLRLYAERVAGGKRDTSAAVTALRRTEADAGLDDPQAFADFASKVDLARARFRAFLEDARGRGRSVVGYGAAAKGNTLLNTIGATTDLVQYVVDRSPHKQHHFLPGSHIPIYPPSRIEETRPDYVVILPWNLTDEIMEQMAHVRAWGGQFVVAIPETRVIP